MITSFHHTRSDFKVFWNVDNKIDFLVRDYDRKPLAVDEINEAYRLVISNEKAGKVLLEKNLVVRDAATGHLALHLTKEEAASLPYGLHHYSIIKLIGDETILLYADRDHYPRSHLEVVSGPIPLAIEPITTLASSFSIIDGGLRAGSYEGPAIMADGSNMRTFAFYVEGYSGEIAIEATNTPSVPSQASDWVEITREAFVDATETRLLNILGNYTFLRVLREDSTGTFLKLTLR